MVNPPGTVATAPTNRRSVASAASARGLPQQATGLPFRRYRPTFRREDDISDARSASSPHGLDTSPTVRCRECVVLCSVLRPALCPRIAYQIRRVAQHLLAELTLHDLHSHIGSRGVQSRSDQTRAQ